MFTKPRQLSLLAAAILAAIPLFNASANAQVYTPGTPYQPAPPVEAAQPQAANLTQDQLDQLLAPVALYPDPLLAQLLPAATFPNDIANAAGYINANPNVTEANLDAQPWDPSVRALAHYPTVLMQLANNMDWTQALGAAFVNQQQDVMNSIQRLRAEAQSAGSLATNQQQQVVADQGEIQIVPADPQVIYVPTYDPGVVYYQNAPLTYGPGFRFGLWLNNGFDWGHHFVTRDFDWAHFRDHRNDHRPEVITHPWVRDNRHAAVPVMPAHYAPRGPAVRPGYEHPAAPVRAFNPAVQRQEIQRAEVRGRPEVVHPAPAPRVVERPAAPAPRVVEHPAPPAPRVIERPAAPAPRPAAPSAPAFHPSGGDGGASARGHSSMHR